MADLHTQPEPDEKVPRNTAENVETQKGEESSQASQVHLLKIKVSNQPTMIEYGEAYNANSDRPALVPALIFFST